MRLHGRVTAIREFSGSDAFVADSLLLVNRFSACRKDKFVELTTGLPERELWLLYYHVDSLSWGGGDLA